MKTAVCLFLAVFVWIQVASACKEGEVWNDGCNTCSCINGELACTEKFCLNVTTTTEGKTWSTKRQTCSPGEQKFESCNRCICSSAGSWSCTNRPCLGKRQAQECTPGDTKKEQCNSCQCTSTGIWGCTKRACPVDQECSPGDNKMEQCNSCWCTPTGRWACTKIRCPPEPECLEGESKKQDCNTCFCSNGKWGCTLMACAPQITECKEGETQTRDCNSCGCVNGQWACTLKACVPIKGDQPECQEGDTKTEDCNTCGCVNERWACTLQACAPVNADQPEIAPFAGEVQQRSKRESSISEDLKDIPCAPNDFFKLDCNTCYCNLERTGYLCTENTCRQEAMADFHSTTSIPLKKGAKLLIFNERHEILRRVDAKNDLPGDVANELTVSSSNPPTTVEENTYTEVIDHKNDNHSLGIEINALQNMTKNIVLNIGTNVDGNTSAKNIDGNLSHEQYTPNINDLKNKSLDDGPKHISIDIPMELSVVELVSANNTLNDPDADVRSAPNNTMSSIGSSRNETV